MRLSARGIAIKAPVGPYSKVIARK